MSAIYVGEPPTSGKIVLETTAGELEIELWSKEAPKACRNFVQLCAEGYYDGTIFHRVVPGWIVQGGDPTGTGGGGASIYGKPFADEFHSRLRFNRRGLLGMASTAPDENSSQFFITLAATPELQRKSTLFGTVVGDSVFNALRLGEGEIDTDTERPIHPKTIKRACVLDNPFADLALRTMPKPLKIPSDSETKVQIKRAKTVKNTKLLSFDDADDDEDDILTTVDHTRSKIKSRHDLLDFDSTPSKKHITKVDVVDTIRPAAPELNPEPLVSQEHAITPSSNSDKKDITHVGGEAQPFTKETKQKGRKYTGAKRYKKGMDEDVLLTRLGTFKAKIRDSKADCDNSNWLAHSLRYSNSEEQSTKSRGADVEDYVVVDPRQSRGS
ncbi:cyclophilin-like protein [Coemansia reversa NRRL 1564]|uniref:Peptidyl-prolyl isomerase CWC27 n=1 Tax=Coemansia reversa (strain ATCC 12441 / NRRL 1564) TaxID=763665 RepID=A0A2G5B5Z5_COERN|nr:cyclophilin-like protein [Coemansia reversa NRRL 1564]|eukprot:PIA14420.1 cyclophilin-like protein [Coemansia reversa NRRL 1564]